MHENRETSGVPRSDEDRGRSAKATSHKAGMYAPEESDYAAVPMNQPNKGGQPSAEVGEGRAWTKENIVQSSTSPTQGGERVSQGLRGVQQAARARKQERFTALLHHLTIHLLRDSFYALKRQAAPGVEAGRGSSQGKVGGRAANERIGFPLHFDTRGVRISL
jgi:hypothetical protein